MCLNLINCAALETILCKRHDMKNKFLSILAVGLLAAPLGTRTL